MIDMELENEMSKPHKMEEKINSKNQKVCGIKVFRNK